MENKSILVLSRKDIYHPRAGGAEQIMHTYMKGLIDAGYCVTQIAPQFSGSSKSEQIDGITIKRMFSIHTIYFAFWFWYLFIRKEQYDLIIDHAGGIPLLSPVYIQNKPIVFFTHHVGTKERAEYFQQRLGIGLIGKVFQWIYNTIILRLYRKKPTITVSQGTAQELRKLGFQNIHVLPNTTDYPRIEFTVPKKELVLTTVGRVVPNKQFSHALYLLKTLHNAGLPYHLNIVGAIQDKTEYVYLENIIKTEQLNDFVTFHGKLGTQELIELWDKSRYGLIMSDKEGFGLTTLEANSRGVPMLGYSIPGVNEVIHDGENGWLISKNDRNEGAHRIMGTSEDEYEQLVNETVQFITTYPTWELNQKEFVTLIKSVCKVNNRSKNLFNRLLGLIPVSIKQSLKEKAQTLSDRNFLILSYFLTFGRIVNLDNPKTYTEKIQWFKLHQTDKRFSDLADKFAVRSYVQSKIQNDILVPLYRHGANPEAIPFETLPESFVIKCNHGSGFNIFVQDKTRCDQNAIKIQLAQWLATDFWKIGRELQYKNIEKQIVIEQLLIDEKYSVPVDYKLYCFNGKPLYVGVITGRYSNQSNDYYDIEWNKQPFSCVFPRSNHDVEKPTCLQKMIDYASILSSGFPFMRVDFYQVNGKVYFGEITFTPDSGYGKFKPNSRKIDRLFGDLIILPKAI